MARTSRHGLFDEQQISEHNLALVGSNADFKLAFAPRFFPSGGPAVSDGANFSFNKTVSALHAEKMLERSSRTATVGKVIVHHVQLAAEQSRNLACRCGLAK